MHRALTRPINRLARSALPVIGIGVTRTRGPRSRAVLVGAVGTLVSLTSPMRAQCPDGTPPPCPIAAPRSAPPHSVAVLYFDNLSRDSADEYLADGLTEQLIVRLARIERLDVRLRSEVQRFHGRPLTDPAGVARALNVRYLLAGSVRKVGPRVVVTVELSQPSVRPSRVWSDVIDQSSPDVLDVEAGIAEAVASAVAGRLRPEERAAAVRRPTRDAQAYELYLQANRYVERGIATASEAETRTAVAFYRTATERDSTFVAAWEALAWTWHFLSQLVPARPAMLEAREAATRALALDSTSGDAMAVEALVVAGLELDWPLAEATAHRGIRAAPRAVRPWQSLAFLLGSMGRFDEAIAVAESALVRDSLSVANHWAMAMLLIDGHRWDQFPVWEERWRASDPVLAAYARGYSALHDQRPHDALRAFRTLPYQDIVVEVEALIACDSTASARALVARERSRADTQLRDTGFYVVADGLAAGYAMLGEIDEAFVWLERAYGWANTNLLWRLKVFPGFERLRADPRYRDLLQRMRLEH